MRSNSRDLESIHCHIVDVSVLLIQPTLSWDSEEQSTKMAEMMVGGVETG